MLAAVTARVRAARLNVVAEQSVPFPGGGATLVWVLAESHVVMHLCPEQDRPDGRSDYAGAGDRSRAFERSPRPSAGSGGGGA